MKRHYQLLLLGILVIVLPFFPVPPSGKRWLFAIVGALIIHMSYRMYVEYQERIRVIKLPGTDE